MAQQIDRLRLHHECSHIYRLCDPRAPLLAAAHKKAHTTRLRCIVGRSLPCQCAFQPVMTLAYPCLLCCSVRTSSVRCAPAVYVAPSPSLLNSNSPRPIAPSSQPNANLVAESPGRPALARGVRRPLRSAGRRPISVTTPASSVRPFPPLSPM